MRLGNYSLVVIYEYSDSIGSIVAGYDGVLREDMDVEVRGVLEDLALGSLACFAD